MCYKTATRELALPSVQCTYRSSVSLFNLSVSVTFKIGYHTVYSCIRGKIIYKSRGKFWIEVKYANNSHFSMVDPPNGFVSVFFYPSLSLSLSFHLLWIWFVHVTAIVTYDASGELIICIWLHYVSCKTNSIWCNFWLVCWGGFLQNDTIPYTVYAKSTESKSRCNADESKQTKYYK